MAISAGMVPVSVSAQTGAEYYDENVASAASACLACHISGGVASSSRLILSNSGSNQSATNYAVFEEFVLDPNKGAVLLLTKLSGGLSHEGGTVHAVGSDGYNAFEGLTVFITTGGDGGGNGGGSGGDSGSGDSSNEVIQDLVVEPRNQLLERARQLFGL